MLSHCTPLAHRPAVAQTFFDNACKLDAGIKSMEDEVRPCHAPFPWPRPSALNIIFLSPRSARTPTLAPSCFQVDMPIIVGEWSLATDNCAMWLNGFNDNLPGFPKARHSPR